MLGAPQWATEASTSVFASGELPVEIREPLSSLTSFITAIPEGGNSTTTPYEVETLSLLGENGTGNDTELLMAATFQAQPFAEPMTRLSYVRARWYDPVTGTWLSPDPMGYVDSSNLYAFAGGDPINGRDPDGLNARPARRPARVPRKPPAPRQRPTPGEPPVLEAPAQYAPRYAPGDWLEFRDAVEAAKAARPKGAGARAFGGRTVEE